ncbi:ABC transporter permease [Alkalihalobacillus sp. BA299]|uniref:ABC transporter permease n=1 Tax=Alkalihalobacillus sp. BA299 TaxID=2815938 RepID=UPI001FFE1A53|nr:ribose ABC transporter permease [Alkalihalobacillus sp. BA299]
MEAKLDKQTKTTNNEGLKKIDLKYLLSEYGIILALLAIITLISILTPNFMTFQNLMNLGRQVSINAILAIGMTFVILARGIDLSVGSILAFAGIVSASFATGPDGNFFLAVVMGLGAGLLLGFINGFTVAKWNVAPFIVTLGMMAIARGFTFIYNDGRPVSGLSDSFLQIGGGYILGIPIPILITLIVFIVFSVILYNTKFGRHVYAIGGNEMAAKISGIKVNRTTIWVYSISGLLAGLAGLILTSRVSAGLPQAGVSYELDAIAAVVIGGTSLMGGKGRLWGTLVGAMIIGVLNNGLDLLGVSSYWQQVIKGFIIILAVMIDRKRS